MSSATIGRPVNLRGVAWSGRGQAAARFVPAEPGTGIVFNGFLHARPETAGARHHHTCIGRGGSRIHMVEHLLAACSCLGITDLGVETAGDSLPFGDGSASPYVGAFSRAGIVRTEPGPRPLRLRRTINLKFGAGRIQALPARRARISCRIELEGIGSQMVTVHPAEDELAREIAPARTFALTTAASGDVRRRYRLPFRLKRVGRYVLAARERLRDEPCRHKLLDLLGDLWLLGRPVVARIAAFRPSHELNIMLVRRLEEQ